MRKQHAHLVGRRQFLRSTAGTALTIAGTLSPHLVRGVRAVASPEDLPATHNMLVFGRHSVYLSHLPMFQRLDGTGRQFLSPHRYQVLLEAMFTKDGKDLQDAYSSEREAHPETVIYTLNPEQFVLSHLFEPAESPIRSSFGATVFRGHLEVGGTPLDNFEGIVVEISRVLHARQFDPQAPMTAQLEYLVVGDTTEQFLVHTIFGPPDFDQVLSVTLEEPLSDEDSREVTKIVLEDRKNVSAERLRAGERVEGLLQNGSTPDATSKQVQLEVGPQVYFEEGELLVPPTFKPTPEEEKGE